MSNPTITQVREAVAALVTRLNGATGVTTNIASDHIYSGYSKMMADKKDASYPKAVITTDGGKSAEAVSRTRNKAVSFDIIFVCKKTPDGVNEEVDIQCDKFIEDFEKRLDEDTTLGDTVDDAFIVEWTSDSGFAAPEGVVWIKFGVEYRKTR